ncbi:MAG: hypothetical protein Q9188_004013 [Gyalolechia gomerana]
MARQSIRAIALVASGGLLGSQIIVGIISFMNPVSLYTLETGPDGIAWLLGLLQAGLGLTAYDAVAHMIEGGPHRTLPQTPALKALQKSQTQQFKGLVL